MSSRGQSSHVRYTIYNTLCPSTLTTNQENLPPKKKHTCKLLRCSVWLTRACSWRPEDKAGAKQRSPGLEEDRFNPSTRFFLLLLQHNTYTAHLLSSTLNTTDLFFLVNYFISFLAIKNHNTFIGQLLYICIYNKFSLMVQLEVLKTDRLKHNENQ